jgi:hypothetical protein
MACIYRYVDGYEKLTELLLPHRFSALPMERSIVTSSR